MSAQPALRPEATVHQIPSGINVRAVAKEVAKGELVVMDTATGEAVIDPRDLIAGLLRTVESQSKTIGSLSRQLEEESDPDLERNGNARDVAKRWITATQRNPKTTKVGKPRVKLVNTAHSWGYDYDSEEWLPVHPTLSLAVDGVSAFPYRLFTRRYREGEQPNGAEKANDLTDALKDEKHVEIAARLGYQARKAGWTAEEGWPA